MIHLADIQDRDGGILLMSTVSGMYPFLENRFADGGYQGAKFRNGLADLLPGLKIEIVKRPDHDKGLWCFQVGGSSNERSPGSSAVEGWPSIGKT